jgi:hypothetical protein
MKIYSYDVAKQKQILAGEIFLEGLNDKVFIKEAKANHFVKIKQGYGISVDVVDRLISEGVTKILIKTPAWNYSSDILDWKNIKLVDDLGNGLQVFLPVQFMNRSK